MKFHLKTIFIIIALFIFGESVYMSAYKNDLGGILSEALDNLSHPEFYQALANPTISYLNVEQGLRKEQIEELASKRFYWGPEDKADFLAYDSERSAKFEGRYHPGIYLVAKDISGDDFKKIMNERFEKKFSAVNAASSTDVMATSTDIILTIASLIEREAAGKSDMKLVSGIIWNRMKRGMPLQVDATLQYAKGTADNGWWPKVYPKDKQIESPYNTYKYKGLPPAPIANPGVDSIMAALDPDETNCLYYFHADRRIFCSPTYAEHKRKIDLYLK